MIKKKQFTIRKKHFPDNMELSAKKQIFSFLFVRDSYYYIDAQYIWQVMLESVDNTLKMVPGGSARYNHWFLTIMIIFTLEKLTYFLI